MSLLSFGLGIEAVALVQDRAVPERDRVMFPFSIGTEVASYEEVAITGRVKKADRGMFIVLPEHCGIPTTAYFFRNVLEMLFFYDRHPRPAFASAALLVDPLPPTWEGMAFVRDAFGHLRNSIIVSPKGAYGTWRTIALAAMVNGRKPEIAEKDGRVTVRMDGKKAEYDVDGFRYASLARDFRIPRTTREIRPAWGASFTEMYARTSKRIRTW